MKKIFITASTILAVNLPIISAVACAEPKDNQDELVNVNFDELIKFEGKLKTEEIKSAIEQITMGKAKSITFKQQEIDFTNYLYGQDETKDNFINSIVEELKKYYPNTLANPPKGYLDTGKLVWEKETFVAPLPVKLFKADLPKIPANTKLLASSEQLYAEEGKAVWRPLEGWQMPIHYDFVNDGPIIFKIKLVANPGFHIKDAQEHQISFTKNEDAPEKIDYLAPFISVDRSTAIEGARIQQGKSGVDELNIVKDQAVSAKQIEDLISYQDNIDGSLSKATVASEKGIHYQWNKPFNVAQAGIYRLSVYAIDSSKNQSDTYILDVKVSE